MYRYRLPAVCLCDIKCTQGSMGLWFSNESRCFTIPSLLHARPHILLILVSGSNLSHNVALQSSATVIVQLGKKLHQGANNATRRHRLKIQLKHCRDPVATLIRS